MNEFVTDLQKQMKAADKCISSSTRVVGTACHDVGEEISSVMQRGKSVCKTVRKRVGKGASAANAAMHSNPYPPVLVGIGAGALLGYLAACKLGGRSG